MEHLNYSLNFDIVCIGHGFLGKEWNYKNYSQNFIKIYFVRKGKGIIRFCDKEIALEPDKLYIVSPSKVADYFVCEAPLEQYWAHFYVNVENNINLFSLMNFHDSIKPDNTEIISYLFRRLYNIYMKSSQLLLFEADAILRFFLATLRRKSIADTESMMRQIERFEPVLDYIERNIAAKIEIKNLASLIHLHPTYFANLFAKVFGMSPLEFIISKKLEKAQKELFFTNRPIKEIACRLGFSDEFYFSRLFKKYLGMAPTQYRQNKKI
jgi:AraC-like DNA-binding protein